MMEPRPPEDFCHIHGVAEPDRPGDYRVCGECGHIYRTAEELVVAMHLADLDTWRFFRSSAAVQPPGEREVWLNTPEPERRDPAKIYACPLCTHDF